MHTTPIYQRFYALDGIQSSGFDRNYQGTQNWKAVLLFPRQDLPRAQKLLGWIFDDRDNFLRDFLKNFSLEVNSQPQRFPREFRAVVQKMATVGWGYEDTGILDKRTFSLVSDFDYDTSTMGKALDFYLKNGSLVDSVMATAYSTTIQDFAKTDNSVDYQQWLTDALKGKQSPTLMLSPSGEFYGAWSAEPYRTIQKRALSSVQSQKTYKIVRNVAIGSAVVLGIYGALRAFEMSKNITR